MDYTKINIKWISEFPQGQLHFDEVERVLGDIVLSLWQMSNVPAENSVSHSGAYKLRMIQTSIFIFDDKTCIETI